MKIQPISPDNFSEFGSILNEYPFVPLDPNEEFTWKDMSGDLKMFSPSCTGQLNCRFRDKVLKKVERHLKTPELMVALKGDSLLCVAKATLDAPQEQDVRCFEVKEGTVLMMNTAVWHWIPYPLQEPGSEFLVLFRDGTGADDLNFHEFGSDIQVG